MTSSKEAAEEAARRWPPGGTGLPFPEYYGFIAGAEWMGAQVAERLGPMGTAMTSKEAAEAAEEAERRYPLIRLNDLVDAAEAYARTYRAFDELMERDPDGEEIRVIARKVQQNEAWLHRCALRILEGSGND